MANNCRASRARRHHRGHHHKMAGNRKSVCLVWGLAGRSVCSGAQMREEAVRLTEWGGGGRLGHHLPPSPHLFLSHSKLHLLCRVCSPVDMHDHGPCLPLTTPDSRWTCSTRTGCDQGFHVPSYLSGLSPVVCLRP